MRLPLWYGQGLVQALTQAGRYCADIAHRLGGIVQALTQAGRYCADIAHRLGSIVQALTQAGRYCAGINTGWEVLRRHCTQAGRYCAGIAHRLGGIVQTLHTGWEVLCRHCIPLSLLEGIAGLSSEGACPRMGIKELSCQLVDGRERMGRGRLDAAPQSTDGAH